MSCARQMFGWLALLAFVLAFFDYRVIGTELRSKEDSCFCDLKGQIDDCPCTVDVVDQFNNGKIYPLLQTLLKRPYFRYFRYNAQRKCEFWDDSDASCDSLGCRVQECSIDELPDGLRDNESQCTGNTAESPSFKYLESTQLDSIEDVDETLSDDAVASILQWSDHDDQVQFCQLDDNEKGLCPDCTHVDLTLNPERYTGYRGEKANRIWRSIYEENCFKPRLDDADGGDFSRSSRENYPWFFNQNINKMCLEERAFFRAISGLHTSITVHLCAKYHYQVKQDPLSLPIDEWRPNMDEFNRRFSVVATQGESVPRLKNLYFVYLLELRALAKAATYLSRLHNYYTGLSDEDVETEAQVSQLMEVIRSFGHDNREFDETAMFRDSKSSSQLLGQFQSHFYNISRITDCVTCDKCKLWAKLQITGLGTALKILFHPALSESTPVAESATTANFRLSRNEVVALFNAFGRISNSIHHLSWFKSQIT